MLTINLNKCKKNFLLNFQGYNHSIEECSEIISDYEMKDTQVLRKVTNLYMGRKAFLRSGQDELDHRCATFFTSQVCHELFTFPNHQQSDG